MLIKTRLALAVALALGTASAAQAQQRHTAPHDHVERSLQSRDAAMPRERVPSAAEENWMDRASDGYGGGY
jgi:hypothetical protein